MIKVQGNYDRLEIFFWDLVFWAMKVLQGLRNTWIKTLNRIMPSLKVHLFWLLVVCSFGLVFGFFLGLGKGVIGR